MAATDILLARWVRTNGTLLVAALGSVRPRHARELAALLGIDAAKLAAAARAELERRARARSSR